MKRSLLVALLFIMVATGSLAADGFSGWRQSSTKHFVFVYEPRDSVTVAELCSFAEEVYAKVTNLLESYPKKIWVIVNGRVDTANGADFSFPSGIILYVTSPTVPILGFKEHEYLRMLLTHELTHYVQFNYDRGFFSVLSRILGSGLKPGDAGFLPGWMVEGITTNTETMFTRGGRGRDPYFELQYKALVLDNHFFSLDQAGYGSAYPPRSRIYLGGYLMVHYLLEHYGEDAYTRIHQRYVKFPFFGPWAAIQKVTGQSAHEIYLDMLSDLREKYAQYRRIPSGASLSPEGTGDYYLPIKTTNGWFAYQDTLRSGPAIVRFDPESGRETPILHAVLTDYTSLTATADGEKLVFSTFRATTTRAGSQLDAVLYSLDPAAGVVHLVTPTAHLWQPALSPNGKLLIAVERRGSYSRLVSIDQSTGRVSSLYSRPDTNIYNPVFSPDGSRIAFTVNDHGSLRIYTMGVVEGTSGSINAGLAVPLPGAPDANAYFPHFHGNDAVTFSADLGNGLALYESGISGHRLLRVAEDPVGVAAGFFDGNKIVYTTYSGNGYAVKELTAKEILQNPARLPQGATAESVATSRTLAIPQSSRYVDWPRPLYWLPVPFYDYVGSSTAGLPFGFGVFGMATSLLGRNQVEGVLTFRTDVVQPSVFLNLQSMIGRNQLTYSVTGGYAASTPPTYTQSLSQSLSLSIPLLSEYLLGTTTVLSLTPGISDRLDVSKAQPFNFTLPISPPQGFTVANGYSLNLGVSLSRYRSGGAEDIFEPQDLELSAQGQYYPSLFSNATAGIDSVLYGSVAMPSFLPHQVIKLGIKSSYSSILGTRAPVVNPRGLFLAGSTPTPTDTQSTQGRSVLSLGYLATLTLADSPLPFGFNFQGFGMGVHLEVAADWSLSGATFTPDPYLYAGLELVSLVGYYGDGSPLPIGIGVSVRFDPSFRRAFTPLYDIGPYIFIGTDSFSSAAASRAGAGASLLRAFGRRERFAELFP